MAASIEAPVLSTEQRLRQAAKILAVGAIRYAAKQVGEKTNTIDVDDTRQEDSIHSQENKHSPEQKAA